MNVEALKGMVEEEMDMGACGQHGLLLVGAEHSVASFGAEQRKGQLSMAAAAPHTAAVAASSSSSSGSRCRGR